MSKVFALLSVFFFIIGVVSCKNTSSTTPDNMVKTKHTADNVKSVTSSVSEFEIPSYIENSTPNPKNISIFNLLDPEVKSKLNYSDNLSRLAYFIAAYKGKVFKVTSLMKLLPRFGIAYPWVSHNFLIAEGKQSDREFAMWISKILRETKDESHYGFALRNGVCVLLMQKRKISLVPFKSHLNYGESLQIKGTIKDNTKSVTFIVTDPEGKVSKHLPSMSNKDFSFIFNQCNSDKNRGIYNIEIISNNSSGPAVSGLFDLVCGNTKVPSLNPELENENVIYTDNAVKAEVFKLINKYRQKFNLKPLYWNKTLAAAAESHSIEMCKTGKLTHISSLTGTPMDRAHKYGLQPLVLAENIGVANSPEEMVNGWIISVGHRLNLLNKKVEYAGIGVCQIKDGTSDIKAIYVTLLLAKF